jgi:O-antigen ligase
MSTAGPTIALRTPSWLMGAGLLVLAVAVALFIGTQAWPFLLVPFGLLALAMGLKDYRLLFFWMWASIPFSVEVDLPGGLSTDFPDEPLMWLLCLLLPAFLYLRHRSLRFDFLVHPLAVLLLLHFFWILVTAVTAQEPLLAAKYSLAKTWYFACCIVLPVWLFRDMGDIRRWAAWLFVPLILSVLVILYRHYGTDFSFATINNAVIPIYRNHVDYACCLGILLPFGWMIRSWMRPGWPRMGMNAALAIMVVGIYFSYTRAAYLCIPLAIGLYVIVRMGWMKIAIAGALIAAVAGLAWMAHENRYIEYAPDYEKTITHTHFDDLVSATARMEDISTVERFYRWVAAYYMILDKPVLGFGPAGFYSAYHSYVDRHFTTYVSDNPEHSSTHNYYLMVAVEQGLPGLLLFLALVIGVLLYGERLWHRMPAGPDRGLVMVAVVSFGLNLFILTLNDTVETDKLGTFFFLCIALVIWQGLRHPSPAERPAPAPGVSDPSA